MKTPLDGTAERLGEGEVVRLSSRTNLFKLASCPNNPVVKPQELGLTRRDKTKVLPGSVFNPGAELLDGKVVLTPRCHKNYEKAKFFDSRLGKERVYLKNYVSEIWPLVSEDGIHFTRMGTKVIRGDGTEHKDFLYGIEDLRIIRHGERFLLVGCGKVKPPFRGENADRLAIYSTTDFVDIHYHGIVTFFDSRNGVPFPDFVDQDFYMLLRFHPNTHLERLQEGPEQLLNPGRHTDMWKEIYARRNDTILLASGDYPHEQEKTGPGPQVIETHAGWLLLYHAVGEISSQIASVYGLSQGIDRAYSICAALLDLEHPEKIIARTRLPIYIPSLPWELHGSEEHPVDVPAVVFPVGAFVHHGKLFLYCGAGDKYTVLLGCTLETLLDYLLHFQ